MEDKMDVILRTVYENRSKQIGIFDDVSISEAKFTLARLEKRLVVETKACSLSNQKPGNLRCFRKRDKRNLTNLFPIIRKGIVLAVSILIVSAVFSLMDGVPRVKAFRFQIEKTFTELTNGFIQVKQSTMDTSDEYGPEAPPLPKEGEAENSQVIVRNLSLEQARKELPVTLAVPGYIPDSYKFEYVEWQKYIDGHHIITQYYQSTDGVIEILQQTNLPNTKETLTINTKNTKTREIEINGQIILLMTTNGGICRAYWKEDDITYMITAMLPEYEVIKIIETL